MDGITLSFTDARPVLAPGALEEQGRGGAHLLLQRAGGQHRPRVGKGQGDAVHAQPSLA